MANPNDGSDMLSQQALLQSYMGNILQHQNQAQQPQQQPQLHPGLPAAFHQQQQRQQQMFMQQPQQPQQQQQQQQQQQMWNQQQQPNRPLFPGQQTPGMPPQQPAAPPNGGGMSQAEFSAMLASLQGSSAPPPPSQPMQQTPQPPIMQQQSQQQNQQGQVQGYPAALQAAFQQLQQQQQQQYQPPQQQQQPDQAVGSAGGLDPANLNMLLQLRQKGIQLTPEQQALLTRNMPRRGGIGDANPGGPSANPGQMQQQQGMPMPGGMPFPHAQQQMLTAAGSGARPTPGGQGGMPLQTQQQQFANMLQQPPPQQAPVQVPNPGAPLGGVMPAVTVPLSAMQEYTSLNDQLRNYLSVESHLTACLNSGLAIPLPQPLGSLAPTLHDGEGKPVLSVNTGQQPQAMAGGGPPLLPTQRRALEQHRENFRAAAAGARARNTALEQQYAGRENILQNLKLYALSRQAAAQQQQAIRAGMGTPVNNNAALPMQQQQQPTPPQGNRTIPQTQQQQNRGPLLPQQQQQPGQQQQMNAFQNQLQRLVQAQSQGSMPQQQPQGTPQPLVPQQPQAPTQPQQPAQAPPTSFQAQPPPNPLQGPGAMSSPNLSQQQQQLPAPGTPAHAALLRAQQVAVNEEILKTLNAAGPDTFRKALYDTMKKRGKPIVTVPKVENKDVDLHRLYRVVQQRGGCGPIRQQGLWRQVGLEIGITAPDPEAGQRVFAALEKVYADYLEPFEEIQRKAASNTISRQMAASAAGQRPPQQQQQGMTSPALPSVQPQTMPGQPQSQNGGFRPQGHARTLSMASQPGQGVPSADQQVTPAGNNVQQQPPAQPFGPSGRPPANMPSQGQIQAAKAEIEGMKAGLQNNRPQYKVLDGIDAQEQAKFLALTKSLQPMVDKVLELLPLYLALSTQTEGARRLLVMMYMFRDQVQAFEQRKEYILRYSDLEKLKVQLQRCWTFVSQTASGAIASPAPAANPQLPPTGNAVGAGIENTNFQGVVMRTSGLKMEDLKQPPGSRPKRQQSGLSASAAADGFSSPSATAGNGGSYASPIQLDSPSPEKAGTAGLPAAGKKAKSGQTPESAASAPTPKSSTTVSTTKAGKKGRGAVNAKTPLGNEITYDDSSAAAAAQTQGQSPALGKPSPAAGTGTPGTGQTSLPSQSQARQAQMQSQMQAHAQVSLKRKRELEEAHADPAGFSERIFADFLAPTASTSSVPPALPGTAPTAAPAGIDGLGGIDWLSFLNEDVLEETPASKKEKLDFGSTTQQPSQPLNNALGLKWYSETPNFITAETPELDSSPHSLHADAQRTSPAGTEVFTPSDQNNNNNKTGRISAYSISPASRNIGAAAKAGPTGTNAIMASFDREYERLFSDIPGSQLGLPPAATASAESTGLDFAWTWDAGLLPPAPVAMGMVSSLPA